MTVKQSFFISSAIDWYRCSEHAWESLDVSRKLSENRRKKKKKRQGLWSTTSVMNSQQDAWTIDPPFSWPFPMVPSRRHCHSDNGDRRVRRPSVSCCSHSSVQLDSPSAGFWPSAALRGPVRHWTYLKLLCAVCEDAVWSLNNLLKFYCILKAELLYLTIQSLYSLRKTG